MADEFVYIGIAMTSPDVIPYLISQCLYHSALNEAMKFNLHTVKSLF